MISTADQLLFSQSAVRRLFNVADKVEVQIKVFANSVWVWVKGKRPTFVSKRIFLQHFVDRRRDAGSKLEVKQINPELFAVKGSHDKSYLVTLGSTELTCTCSDYGNQKQFFNRGCCKHGYAVLGQLGYSSLREYARINQAIAS